MDTYGYFAENKKALRNRRRYEKEHGIKIPADHILATSWWCVEKGCERYIGSDPCPDHPDTLQVTMIPDPGKDDEAF